jgi:hypothetical protein
VNVAGLPALHVSPPSGYVKSRDGMTSEKFALEVSPTDKLDVRKTLILADEVAGFVTVHG